jgi:hypothetical protein
MALRQVSDSQNREQFDAWTSYVRDTLLVAKRYIHIVAVNRDRLLKEVCGSGEVPLYPFHSEQFFVNCLMNQRWFCKGIDLSLTAFYRVHWPFFRDDGLIPTRNSWPGF